MRRGRGLFWRRRGRQGQTAAPESGPHVLGPLGPLEPLGRSPTVGDRLVRLGALEKGEWATIEGFDAGHSLISRLAALGFTPGAGVEMIQNFGRGPVIVSVRDTRIALGRGEASKVLVKKGTGPTS